MNQSMLTIQKGYRITQIPIAFTKMSQMETQEIETDYDDDYEEEELHEVSIYFSDADISTTEDELDYNPWMDVYSPDYVSKNETKDQPEEINVALYLAEAENQVFTNKASKETPKLNVGPLEYHQQRSLEKLLDEYQDICAKSQTEIGRTTEIKHRIYTGDNAPVTQRPYRTNPDNTKFIEEEIDRMLKAGIIRPSYSPWASPVIVV